jgi:hypothetical protein
MEDKKIKNVSREEFESKLEELSNLKQFFSKYFDVEIYDGFDDMTGIYAWSITSDSVHWSYDKNEDFDIEDEDFEYEYGGEIYGTSIWNKKDFTLVRYDNGSGEIISAVFDNKSRR